MQHSEGHVRGGRARAGARTLPLALAVALGVAAGAVSVGFAQPVPADRLPSALLDVTPPSGRVSGAPGRMTIRRTPCRNAPLADVRRRIVDIAVQEWAFFGFSVVDRTNIAAANRTAQRSRRRWRRLSRTESARVADSIAGYWAVTPQGGWIIDAQNKVWNGPRGIAARWRYPWSAAFVSWVMCEGGLGDASRFQRAVAHHVYIDQAIRARRAGETPAGYAAYDIGETPIAPGDLLCSAQASPLSVDRRTAPPDGQWRPDALRHRREARPGPRSHPGHRGQRAGNGGPEAVAGRGRARPGPAPRRRDASPVRPPEAARRADRGGRVRPRADDAASPLRRRIPGAGPARRLADLVPARRQATRC